MRFRNRPFPFPFWACCRVGQTMHFLITQEVAPFTSYSVFLFPSPISTRSSNTQKGMQQKGGGWCFLRNKKDIIPGDLWRPVHVFWVDSEKCIHSKPSQTLPTTATMRDNYTIFPDCEMKHNFTSRLLPFHPPSLQSTFPNTAPCQDQINLLLTEYKWNCINFSTVWEGGAGLWEWFHKVYGKTHVLKVILWPVTLACKGS